jgi:hypothetical protein
VLLLVFLDQHTADAADGHDVLNPLQGQLPSTDSNHHLIKQLETSLHDVKHPLTHAENNFNSQADLYQAAGPSNQHAVTVSTQQLHRLAQQHQGQQEQPLQQQQEQEQEQHQVQQVAFQHQQLQQPQQQVKPAVPGYKHMDASRDIHMHVPTALSTQAPEGDQHDQLHPQQQLQLQQLQQQQVTPGNTHTDLDWSLDLAALASDIDTSWAEWQQQQQQTDWPELRQQMLQQRHHQMLQQQQQAVPLDLQQLVAVPPDKQIPWEELQFEDEIEFGAATQVRH